MLARSPHARVAARRPTHGTSRGTRDATLVTPEPHVNDEAPMESIPWTRDADAAFHEARRAGRMVLLDFSAAPM